MLFIIAYPSSFNTNTHEMLGAVRDASQRRSGADNMRPDACGGSLINAFCVCVCRTLPATLRLCLSRQKQVEVKGLFVCYHIPTCCGSVRYNGSGGLSHSAVHACSESWYCCFGFTGDYGSIGLKAHLFVFIVPAVNIA